MSRPLAVLLALFTFVPQLSLHAETVRCPVTRDIWLSLGSRQEMDTNSGKSPKIKLKVLQEFGLLDFDVSALRGKKVESATLYVAPAGGVRFAKAERGSDLRWFTVSTVSSAWEEGEGRQYALDTAGKGATFNEASYQTRPWTIPGSKVWDVILGNGKTLRDDVDAGDPQGGWFQIPVQPRLVEALVARASYGLCLMDGSSGTDRNSLISSREGANPPYLEVVVTEGGRTAPAAPSGLSAAPAPLDATKSSGALVLSLTVPENALALTVSANGATVPRWQIPFAQKAGSRQEILLEHLPPSAEVKVEVAAVDPAGNSSPAATLQARSGPAIEVPPLPVANPAKARSKPDGAAPGKLQVWAFPEGSKLDPLTGEIALEGGMKGAAQRNGVWDGQSSSVRLAAARGEIASFQLALQPTGGPLENLEVKLEIEGGVSTRLWRAWFVKVKDRWQQEYAIPLGLPAKGARPGLHISAVDNQIAGQKAGVIVADLIIPPECKPGLLRGVVSVSGPGVERHELALAVEVYDVAIPTRVHFNPELNTYGGPAAGTAAFFEFHRLAHYHRAAINRVTHSHSGRTTEDTVPMIDAEGRVKDWSKYDERWGPLLDGSAFAGNPRAGVPVATLYLPHNENWPLMMKPHYRPGVSTEGETWKAVHDIGAKAPEDAFGAEYKEAMVRSVAEFVAHFEAKQWNRTTMQFFQNNKHQYATKGMTGTAWMMDEPNEYLDWQALSFYSRLFHRGLAEARTVNFGYRGDISRPMWQGTLMDGLMEMLYANSDQFSMEPLMRDFKRRSPMALVCYGAANAPERSNHETTAWCLKAYAHECDGVVPWQSLGGDASFDLGDAAGSGNALIVDAQKRFGVPAVASFRLFALRQGAQLAELLRLLEQKRGWGRRHSGALVSQLIPLEARFQQGFADDAAAVQFEAVTGDHFVRLKEGILKLLTE